jgi:DNA-binding FadR family transcriptional regulator
MTVRKHEEIADSLTRDILVGQYRTGERLPSERDLAARFDANRGAVREAMKKLEQLGIACIQPGGARVAPLNEASLDVIGHLLAIGDVPDEDLVDQILVVMQHLITLAAESAVRRATDAELATIRERVQVLSRPDADVLATEARFELMSAIMAASGNLVCQLIARALLAQFAPRMAVLEGCITIDTDAHRRHAAQLDAALAARDAEAVRGIFKTWSDFNRDAARRAFATLRQAPSRPQQVVSS